MLFSRTQKIVKAVTLSTGSSQKEILMAQRNQHLSFKGVEFVLTGNHFCNWCCSSNYWDYLAIVLTGLSETVSFLKTLVAIFMTLLKYAKRYVCEKGNINGRETGFLKILYRGPKKLLTTQVENLHVVSQFNTKHLVLWITLRLWNDSEGIG